MFRTAVETLSAAGHEVKTSDLYAMQFDPVSGRHNFLSAKDPDYFKQQIEEMHATETYGFADDVEEEIQKIEWCDLMIWQFPLWWFGLPGILKGWVDRVFAMGRTYGGERIYANGVFKGKRAMLSLTTGGPAPAYVKGGFNGDIHAILRPIQRGMLQFVGLRGARAADRLRTCAIAAGPENRAAGRLCRAAGKDRQRGTDRCRNLLTGAQVPSRVPGLAWPTFLKIVMTLS